MITSLDYNIENAVTKTLIRRRAEKLWKKKKDLTMADFPDTAYDQGLMQKAIGLGYFARMYWASIGVQRFVNFYEDEPSKVFKRIMHKMPKYPAAMDSRPYGVHIFLHDEDFEEVAGLDNKKPELIAGYVRAGKLDRANVSFGRMAAPKFSKFVEWNLEGIMKDIILNAQFNVNFGLNIDEHLEMEDMVYQQDKLDMLTDWLKNDTHARWTKFGHMEYKRKQDMKKEIAAHEFEHSHFRLGTFTTPRMDELVAHCNHHSLQINLQITDNKKGVFRDIYEKRMGKKSFERFFGLLKRIRDGKCNVTFDTKMKRHVFPMLLREIGSFDYIERELHGIIERVKQL